MREKNLIPWLIAFLTTALSVGVLVRTREPQPAVPPHSHELMAAAPDHESEAAHAASHHGQPRSPEWPKVRAAYLKDHPTCEACGTDKGLQVHHRMPFVDDPSLELNPDNLICLCGPEAHNCHLFLGHSYNFMCYNPNVREEAAAQLKRIKDRPCHVPEKK